MSIDNRPSLLQTITRSTLVGVLIGTSIVAGKKVVYEMNEGLCFWGGIITEEALH